MNANCKDVIIQIVRKNYVESIIDEIEFNRIKQFLRSIFDGNFQPLVDDPDLAFYIFDALGSCSKRPQCNDIQQWYAFFKTIVELTMFQKKEKSSV